MSDEPPRAQSSEAAAASAREHQAMAAGREFDTIRMLMARWGSLAMDIGDDAAVLTPTTGVRVVSTDACVESAHFQRAWLTPYNVGVRAAAAALSDLAAMGASAEYVLVALVVPDDWREDLAAVADGIGAQVARVGAHIIGGNLSRGSQFGITLTVIGTAARPVSRSGAAPGDLVAVTGTLGGPGSALAAWLSGSVPSPWAVQRFVHPEPRLAEGRLLADAGATAMLDISDGLAADAGHIAAASGVRLVLDPALLPCGRGVGAGDALESGEEYELLVTLPQSALHRMRPLWEEHAQVPLTVIGRVEAIPDDDGLIADAESAGAGAGVWVGTSRVTLGGPHGKPGEWHLEGHDHFRDGAVIRVEKARPMGEL